MGRHQIIYTSCMRGINGVNDGQQIYSYDADFQDSKSDDVKRLFTYQVPTLKPGIVMSDALAKTMPQAYTYRKLGNGLCAITLNTYLGRDYMGSAGRYGNHLSHSIICDQDELLYYPCEYYGSPMLRSAMAYEEVNDSARPGFLPVPELTRGYRVDIDNVIEFLSVNDRLAVFKNMMHAMLCFKSERKRVVICDEPENIIMWIAALEYTLPLKMAFNINFSTYEYDPSLSISQICGVIPDGTKFTPDSQRLHFVFDLIRNDTVDFGINNDFYDFVDIAMSFSYDSLQAFHGFLLSRYSYSDVDEKYYSAYILYEILSDGLENVDQDEFEKAMAFLDEYAKEPEVIEVIQQLLFQKDLIYRFNDAYSISVLAYIIKAYPWLPGTLRTEAKTMVIERILIAYLDSRKKEDEFTSFFNNVETICHESGISIANELMKNEHRNKLFTVMQQDVDAWKLAFIVKVLCDYVKVKRLSVDELTPDYAIGNLYSGIVQSVYKANANSGFYIVTRILDNFSDNWNYLINMALNLEGILLDLPSGQRLVDSMWKYFYQVVEKSPNYRANIFKVLSNYDRFEQMFAMYSVLLQGGAVDGQILFREHLNTSVMLNRKYSQAYLARILKTYYEHISRGMNPNKEAIEKELLDLMLKNKLDAPFADELIDEIVKRIPLESPSKENEDVLSAIFDYNFNVRRKGVKGRALIIYIGAHIALSHGRKLPDKLEQIADHKKVDLSGLSRKDAGDYLNWIIPPLTAYCQRAEELVQIYNLFNMSKSISEEFITMCAREYIKQNKSDKDYFRLCEFLEFLFDVGTISDREAAGKALGKLSRQKLELLDKEVQIFFARDRKALRYWAEVYEIASSTNPLLSNISNIFKRKKD